MDSLRSAVGDYIALHGGVREASRASGLDAGYLSRLWSGEKANPSTKTLEILKIKRTVSYEFTGPMPRNEHQ
jgi:transcriptional regulator with XRE-family HTH domain